MKRLIFLFASFAYLLSSTFAQSTEELSGFLFNQFKEGVVYYRDGRQFGVPLNYNLITRQFVFIDKKDDNQKKEFSEVNMIVAIEVEGRSFLSPVEGATEIIQAEPPFYVSYEGSIRREKTVAYGGKTQTASVDSYSQTLGVGRGGSAEDIQKSVASVNKEYQIKIGKKNKRFSTEKQFLKLFPEQKKTLTHYLEEKQVDFDNITQVLALYNYACSLK